MHESKMTSYLLPLLRLLFVFIIHDDDKTRSRGQCVGRQPELGQPTHARAHVSSFMLMKKTARKACGEYAVCTTKLEQYSFIVLF